MNNWDRLFIAGIMGSIAVSLNVEAGKECCDGSVQSSSNEVEIAAKAKTDTDPDEPLDFATLHPCTRQKVTAIGYTSSGKPTFRSRIIWDGDNPGFETTAIVKLIQGWD